MKLIYLQQVPFETPAHVGRWAAGRGFDVSGVHLFDGHKLPEVNDFDWLVVLGGPMSVSDRQRYPWLADEEDLIRRAVEARRVVIGLCLGAQLMAEALGGRVYSAGQREIGWHEVCLTGRGAHDSLLCDWPQRFHVFQWHAETFDIPPDAIHLFASEACHNQAFQYDRCAYALQFHLEMGEPQIRELIENSPDMSYEGPLVQSSEEMLELTGQHEPAARRLCERLLNSILQHC